MKKIFSVLLILAMVFSCVSMITFATEEENIIGVTLTAGSDMASGYSTSGMISATGTFTEADLVDGKIKTTVRVVNNNDFTVGISVAFFEKASGSWIWENKSISLAAKASTTVEVTSALIFTQNGDSYTAPYNNGTNDFTINLKDMMLRIQATSAIAAGTSVTFIANDTRGVERLQTLKKAANATWTVSDYAALGSVEAPEPTLGGASIITTNRNHRCSAPSQELVSGLNEYGMGTYYVSGYVRFLETPDKPVTVGIGATLVADTTSWPQTAKLTISDNQWHKVSGTWNILKENITSLKTFAEVLYSGQSGDAGAYLEDMEWDAFTVCYVYPDGTYGENLFKNPDMNIDASGNTVSWGKNQGFTMTNSLVPVQDENALHVEDRSSNTSGPSQKLTGRLEKGTYLYSAYVRLVEVPQSATAFQLGIELTLNGAGVGWPQTTAVSISDNQWHKITGTVNINKDFDSAVTFINEANAYDMEMDGVLLAKQNEDGTYSENIILNPTMEFDENGTTTDWGTYRVATLTNTGFTTEAPEEPDTGFNGVENPDGTISYANGYVPVTDKNIIYSGRWYDLGESSKQVAFEGYTEIKFTGTSIKVIPGSGSAYAEIDGVLGHTLYSMSACNITGLSDGEHTLKLFAQAQTSRFSIGGFVLDKNAKTMIIEEPKKIEFIGDSISEGYVAPADKLSDLATNSYLNSFTLKTGRKLNKEYGWSFNTVAFGGIGVILRNSPDPLTMPERYFTSREYISSTDGTTQESALAAAGTYDKKYVPDYIVINLGTNDSGQDNKAFIDAYVQFIADLKEINPNVTIFCMAPFNGSKALQVRMAAETYGADEKVIFIDSSKWGIEGGADGLHPAPTSLDVAAEKLFAVIKDYEDNGNLPEVEPFVNGMQFNVTSDIYHAYPYFRASATNATGLTKADADENGYITRSYTVYNVGNCDLPIRIYWQTGWDDVVDSSAIKDLTVKKGTKETFVIKVQIDEDGMVTRKKDGEKVELSTLTFRTQINIGTASETVIPVGASYIVTPDDPADLAVINIGSKAVQKGTNGTGDVTYNTLTALPEEKIQGASLDLGETLTLNYYASLWENTDAILRVTRNNQAVELNGAYDSETGMYLFKYTGINPQCMTDNIKAELVVDGKVISTKDEYSVKAYADNQAKKTAAQLNMTDEKYSSFITLLSDMLLYGENSQKYMNYRTDSLATTGITWLKASEFTAPENVIKSANNTDANNRVLSAGVRVENVNRIYFSLKITDADVEVYVDGVKKEIVDNKVYTDDIKATGFGTTHRVELKKNGETVASAEYNVNAYINNKSNDASVGDLVKALNNYGISAVNYGG